MHTVEGFKVWYADGGVVRSRYWSTVPDDEIQIVVTYMEEEWTPGRPYREVIDGCDWYYQTAGERIKGVQSKSFDSFEPRPEGVSSVKRGTGIPKAQFDQISKEAWNELTF